MANTFVPADFDVPQGLEGEGFRLVPLDPQHNAADFAAWTSSMEHIRSTPGFDGRPWPTEISPEENLRDLRQHAIDFSERSGFTYTVLDDIGNVIGCVYIYPGVEHVDADVRSWVSADHADLDGPLYRTVREWLNSAWPFSLYDYAERKH
jgi:hypothetical protein